MRNYIDMKMINAGFIFIGYDGKPCERTPLNYPYSYDPFVIWRSEEFSEEAMKSPYWNSTFSDRMRQWDYKKFDDAWHEVWGGGGKGFRYKKINDIEKFLSLYYGQDVKLLELSEQCNCSSGIPYWCFVFRFTD